MIELLQQPAITMPVAAVGGWIMKMKAAERADRLERDRFQLQALIASMGKQIESADAAAARNNSEMGKWTARIIGFFLVLAVVLLCYFPGFFPAPAIVETVRESRGFFFGLFPGSTRTEFHELNGFIHAKELWVGFGHVVAFYFGQRAAKA